jgi:hypothetical protein
MAGGAQDTGGTLIERLAISGAMLLMSMPLAAATVRGTVTHRPHSAAGRHGDARFEPHDGD